ncbi:serine/threonine-protein phosphatase 6 regulatory ankyrin repeat subunit A-like [Haliotis rubra]|uniref:serine/threonine-protein phosphatase 6 regulatory ankyrin repeat subunit A-like n=1 Tax=Haliotis rubra TaxID=36100 RepID=UPI001EE60BF5|nr:serine/threonine-protein phosphatase 6 regulatory ankyrin repeat subunit A-like [Haliotis rubra]
MVDLGNFLQNRLPPPFLLQDEDEANSVASKGISDEFVKLPTEEEDTIFKAVRLNDVNKISLMLRHGTDVNMVHTGEACMVKCPSLFRNIQMKRYCPLHVAVLHSNMETITVLCYHGADMNIKDGNNRTPIFLATAAARQDVVKYLIGKGVDLNSQTSSKRSALIEAVCLNRLNLVDALIGAGADLELEDIKGTTALGHAMMQPRVSVKVVNRLVEAGCNVNKRTQKGATPLMFAVSLKKLDKIKALIKAGADVNAADDSKITAFHLATNDGQSVNIAKFLLQNGAHPDLKDRFGRTPLENAVMQGKLRVLQLLLLADCDRSYSLLSSDAVQVLCDRVPVFRDWLYKEMYNPKSLKRLCRGSLRHCLTLKGLTAINELQLPQSLKDFLLVRYYD